LLLAGVALPAVARAQCVTSAPAVDACLGGVRIAGAPPSLDLSFMTPGTLDPSITFTRASTATYFDVTGTMQTATTGTPRWDYDPVTHALNGFLVEEARTNLLLNSATLSTQSVTTTAVATTLSFYGTGTVTLSGTSTAGPLTGTGAFPARVSLTFTPTAGTLTLTVTGSVTNAQLEAGAFASSYIPTTGASATRAAEAATMPTAAWFNASASSLMCEYILGQSPNPSIQSRDVCCLSNGGTTNRLLLRAELASSKQAAVVAVVSSTSLQGLLGNNTAGAVAKLGGSWDGTTGLGTLNGAAAVSYATGIPSGLTVLAFGNDFAAAAAYHNGYIRRARYWPRALSAIELQSVTA
jgi:hypothetical protein